jgi:hypothetical protein
MSWFIDFNRLKVNSVLGQAAFERQVGAALTQAMTQFSELLPENIQREPEVPRRSCTSLVIKANYPTLCCAKAYAQQSGGFYG